MKVSFIKKVYIMHTLICSILKSTPTCNVNGYAQSLGYENVVGIKEDVVINIATRLGVTPAQGVLRWGVQRGYSVIPNQK